MSQGPGGKRGGRPRFVPTPEQRALVEAMRLNGFTHRHMAKRIGVSEPTLRRAFKYEILIADPALRNTLAVRSFEKAMKGDIPAIEMWMRRYPGWRIERPSKKAKPVDDESVPPGGVVRFTLNFDDNPEIQARVAEALKDEPEVSFSISRPSGRMLKRETWPDGRVDEVVVREGRV